MNELKRKLIEKNVNDPVKGSIIDLSEEELTIADYSWLGEIIKQSAVVEKIKLPRVSFEEHELIFSILNAATVKNSSLKSLQLKLQFNIECLSPIASQLYVRIRSRLERNRRNIFGIHGGGNIGLGLMADVISKARKKYNIVATTSNSLTRHLINSVNKLWLQHGQTAQNQTTCVNNVKMITRDREDIINLYKESCLVSICVTSSVFPQMAKDIALALIERNKLDGSGLKIMVLMNLPDCAQFVRKHVLNALKLITEDEAYAESIIAAVDFVPTVIDRIVTPIDTQTIKLQLKKQLQEIYKLNPYREGELDAMLDDPERLMTMVSLHQLRFNLFNAEPNFSFYVPTDFAEAKHFSAIRVSPNFTQLETIKNKFINGPHAILAWTGALFGFTKIADAIQHPDIQNMITSMMENEIKPALKAEYENITDAELDLLQRDFIDRCCSNADDTVYRVGRDPLRKLDSGGRIRGTLELIKKHNLNTPTRNLEQGIAAGILYATHQLDPTNVSCQKILEIYKNNHSYSSVLCYHGEVPGGTFTGLDQHNDQQLISGILKRIAHLNKWLGNKQDSRRNIKSSTAVIMAKTKRLPVPANPLIAEKNIIAIASLKNTGQYTSLSNIWQKADVKENAKPQNNLSIIPRLRSANF